MTAIGRFRYSEPAAPRYLLHDGPYTALVTLAGGSWVWVVLEDGNAIAHGGHAGQSDHEAREDAERALDEARLSASRPSFAETI